MIRSRVPSTRPGRPISGNFIQCFDLFPNAVVDGNGRLRTVCLDVIENGFAVVLGKDGPFQLH
jgi:hypothetical protein